MERTTEEVEAAIELRKKIKANGLKRAVELMGDTERSYARRTICHALEAFVAPKVVSQGEPQMRKNRVKRIMASIKGTAERVKGADGRWFVSHGHVIGRDCKKECYDVAARPWEAERSCYGVYKYADIRESDVARHIAACDPETMLQLAADIEALL